MTERVKYPKTPHVHWSTGTSDDKTLVDDNHLQGKFVIVTLKRDGENTTIYNDGMHARSLERPNHPSQSWVKQLAGKIGYLIADGIRVCGENLYAKHTIPYDNLDTYFEVFSVWRDNRCLSWEATLLACAMYGLRTVPVIYKGTYNKEKIIEAFLPYKESEEGYVIRNADNFEYNEFDDNVAKYVNPGFRQTLKESTVHWASAKVIPNKLKINETESNSTPKGVNESKDSE